MRVVAFIIMCATLTLALIVACTLGNVNLFSFDGFVHWLILYLLVGLDMAVLNANL